MRSPTTTTILAPAKVNLVLRVVGRRADGYHLLESLMAPISWCDELTLRAGPARGRLSRVECRVTGPERVAGGGSNLAARAARAVLADLDLAADVSIRLQKRIPVGAGLGGGSSDAAAVLAALPRMLGRRLSRPRLWGLAADLGADVPFFLGCRPAWAAGAGEWLTPVTAFSRLHLVVVVPPRRVTTAWAYANALPPLRTLRRRNAGWTRPRLLRPDAESLKSVVFNDFEEGVELAVPDVKRLRQSLIDAGATATVLSGSGSAMVGIFRSRIDSERAARRFGSPLVAAAVRTVCRRPSVES